MECEIFFDNSFETKTIHFQWIEVHPHFTSDVPLLPVCSGHKTHVRHVRSGQMLPLLSEECSLSTGQAGPSYVGPSTDHSRYSGPLRLVTTFFYPGLPVQSPLVSQDDDMLTDPRDVSSWISMFYLKARCIRQWAASTLNNRTGPVLASLEE